MTKSFNRLIDRVHVFLQVHIQKFENQVQLVVVMHDIEESGDVSLDTTPLQSRVASVSLEPESGFRDLLDNIIILAQFLQQADFTNASAWNPFIFRI